MGPVGVADVAMEIPTKERHTKKHQSVGFY